MFPLKLAISVAFIIILLYDYVLTFGEEVCHSQIRSVLTRLIFEQVEFIWKQSISAVSSVS